MKKSNLNIFPDQYFLYDFTFYARQYTGRCQLGRNLKKVKMGDKARYKAAERRGRSSSGVKVKRWKER